MTSPDDTPIRRLEPETTAEFRKDPQDEAFLARLNGVLAPFQEEDYRDLEETLPTIHVIGTPRSGTTLLIQLLSAHLSVGYVNNLVAAFWRAPIYGIRLSKRLIPPGQRSSFLSTFGRTRGIHEPHEFGYFWSSVLGYTELAEQPDGFEQTVDWDRVGRILVNMTHAYGTAMAFKTLHLAWHVRRMQQTLPRTCFVRVRRDPVENALSILELRRRFLGSEQAWASMKPREYSWLRDRPVAEQLAGQVYYCERAMTRQIEAVGGRNVIETTYEQLCADPRAILAEVRDLLRQQGADVKRLGEPPKTFPVRRHTTTNPPQLAAIRQAVERFYREAP